MRCLSRVLSALLVISLGVSCRGVAAEGLGSDQRDPDQEIRRLIRQLGDEDYFVRQRAQRELARFSFDAYEALEAATADDDFEIASRAEYLLRWMQASQIAEHDPPEVRALLGDYAGQDEATKLLRLRQLAQLPQHSGVAALCRLVRCERSTVLSKHAALELLKLQPLDQPLNRSLADLVGQHLRRSRRPAASWPVAWFRLVEHGQQALDDWTALVEAEHTCLARTTKNQSSPEIVAQLIRLKIAALKRYGRAEQLHAAMQRLLDLEKGNPATLLELVDWLVEEQAWELVEQLETRFAPQFAREPMLLYLVAQRQARAGQAERAEQTASRALALVPGKHPTSLRKHYAMASELQDRGLFGWAEREYRHLIATDTPGGLFAGYARMALAEMLYDQGKPLAAAEELGPLVKALSDRPNPVSSARLDAEEVGSRMNFFYAVHFQQQDNLAKQREYLDKAIEAKACDIDALIASYQLPNQTAAHREKVLKKIKKTAEALKLQIRANPTDPSAYNQYAWLVGNTAGDFDEALRFSQRSIQLNPDSGGYYDTLAHVYFAKGDFEKAVKAQTKAAELQPHSRLIAKKLELFRQRWQQQQQQGQPKPP